MRLDVAIPTVIAVCALLAPIFISLINNRHLEKMKELEQKQENLKLIVLHKRELFENYLKTVGRLSVVKIDRSGPKLPAENQLLSFLEAYYLILPYIPAKEHNYFSDYSIEVFKMDFSNKSNERLSALLGSHILPTIRQELEKLSIEQK